LHIDDDHYRLVWIDLIELVWHVGVSWLRRDSSRWSTSGVMIAIF
jgi:hypothetical protein